MNSQELWNAFSTSGYTALADATPDDAVSHFHLSLLAFGHQDMPRAAELARKAASLAPERVVFAEAAKYLDRVVREGKQNVYVTPEAFGAFIRGGGNVPLYTGVSAALRAVYETYAGLSLLDIGVGDGLALLPALNDRVKSVTLIEPSAALLAVASKALAARGIDADAVNSTLQDFAESEKGRWDVAQGTFSLQSLTPADRLPMLRWLRENSDRLLIAEFDPPNFAAMYSPDRVHYMADRYDKGLVEYAGDNGLVAQGFLMPIMISGFDQGVARTNYEQPIDDWVTQLREAGFTSVEKRLIFNYWWADAYVIDAQ
jgi:Methyltransferase domain